MKLIHTMVLIGVILGAVLIIGCSKTPGTDASSLKCEPREGDTEGYLLKICNYIKDNNIYVSRVDPTKYNIKKVEEGWYPTEYNSENHQMEKTDQSREVLIVHLNCCYSGDIAYIDKETKEVIGFSLGYK